MNSATQNAKVDLQAKRDAEAAEFFRAGMAYIITLDEWIESQRQSAKTDKELALARERKRILETFLHRLYPDEFADTSSAAE
jgi:hypothetical protein